MRPTLVLLALLPGLWGCFNPPMQEPGSPAPAKSNQVKLNVPYDLAWDAVHAVIERNDYHVITEDPNHGIIETQAASGFTLKDADCGRITSLFRYAAQPEEDATAVYNFEVKPADRESSTVSVQATFSAPIQIPFHPLRDQQCLSRGVQEARLLKQIEARGAEEHRPESKPPGN